VIKNNRLALRNRAREILANGFVDDDLVNVNALQHIGEWARISNKIVFRWNDYQSTHLFLLAQMLSRPESDCRRLRQWQGIFHESTLR
jgi:hypothetical protein